MTYKGSITVAIGMPLFVINLKAPRASCELRGCLPTETSGISAVSRLHRLLVSSTLSAKFRGWSAKSEI